MDKRPKVISAAGVVSSSHLAGAKCHGQKRKIPHLVAADSKKLEPRVRVYGISYMAHSIWYRVSGMQHDSKKLGHGCRMIYTGVASFLHLGLEEDHVPTFWLLPQVPSLSFFRLKLTEGPMSK